MKRKRVSTKTHSTVLILLGLLFFWLFSASMYKQYGLCGALAAALVTIWVCLLFRKVLIKPVIIAFGACLNSGCALHYHMGDDFSKQSKSSHNLHGYIIKHTSLTANIYKIVGTNESGTYYRVKSGKIKFAPYGYIKH